MYNPVTRVYGEPHKRPEVQNATIEFMAPSEYMVRFYLFSPLVFISREKLGRKKKHKLFLVGAFRFSAVVTASRSTSEKSQALLQIGCHL